VAASYDPPYLPLRIDYLNIYYELLVEKYPSIEGFLLNFFFFLVIGGSSYISDCIGSSKV